jgi:mannose-1-phosphate guanylyltransferase
VARLVPPERTVVVSRGDHAAHLARELAQGPPTIVLLQPLDRETGMAVLFAAHWIRQWDPDATVTVFPSDHFILKENDFVGHTAEAMALAARHPERLVLLGAPPTHPETEYGWIKPGEPFGETTTGPISAVKAFWEKPDAEHAGRYLHACWLWNTFVFATTLRTLFALGRDLLPAVGARLNQLAVFARTNEEWAIRQT